MADVKELNPFSRFIFSIGRVGTGSVYNLLSRGSRAFILPHTDLPYAREEPGWFLDGPRPTVVLHHRYHERAQAEDLFLSSVQPRMVRLTREPRGHLISLLNRHLYGLLSVNRDFVPTDEDWRRFANDEVAFSLDATVPKHPNVKSYADVDFDDLTPLRIEASLHRICETLDISTEGILPVTGRMTFNTDFEFALNRERVEILVPGSSSRVQLVFVTWHGWEHTGPWDYVCDFDGSKAFPKYFQEPLKVQVFVRCSRRDISLPLRAYRVEYVANWFDQHRTLVCETLQKGVEDLLARYQHFKLRHLPADLEKLMVQNG